jgi:predicted DNA-binding protein (MmcQ/YjbR family)
MRGTVGKTSAAEKAETTLRAICLGYPEAYEDHPWGDTVFKVKGKVFVFMGRTDGSFGISTKLPISGAVALMLPFAEPTGYGLGKSGWVSARFGPKDDVPWAFG